MELKVKAGLILTLIGIIFYIVVLIAFLTFYPYMVIFPFPIVLIIAGWGVLYSGLEQRGRGVLLILFGLGISGFTAGAIVFISNQFAIVWMDAIIALILVFTFFWFFVFCVPGLYKVIQQEDFPEYYIALDLWGCTTSLLTLIYTIIIVITAKKKFSEIFFLTFGLWISIFVFLGAIVAGILYGLAKIY